MKETPQERISAIVAEGEEMERRGEVSTSPKADKVRVAIALHYGGVDAAPWPGLAEVRSFLISSYSFGSNPLPKLRENFGEVWKDLTLKHSEEEEWDVVFPLPQSDYFHPTKIGWKLK